MPRTLGAEMLKATPTEKSKPIFIKRFLKKILQKSDALYIGLDGANLRMGFGVNGTQKLDFDKVNLSDSNSNFYTIYRQTKFLSL